MLYRNIFIGLVVTLLLVVVSIMLLPTPSTWAGTSAEFHTPFVLDSIMACLHLYAAIFFVITLAAYKQKMQIAFAIISSAIIMAALGTIQLPIMDGLDLWHTAWAENGGVALPFVLSSLAYYIGVRKYGKLVGTTTIFTRAILVIPAAVVGAYVYSLLPHVVQVPSEIVYDISNGILVWSLLLNIGALSILLQVRQRIGEHYRAAITWLTIALSASSACLVISLTQALIDPVRETGYLVIICAIFAGFMWLRAGYAFAQTRTY